MTSLKGVAQISAASDAALAAPALLRDINEQASTDVQALFLIPSFAGVLRSFGCGLGCAAFRDINEQASTDVQALFLIPSFAGVLILRLLFCFVSNLHFPICFP